MTVRLSKITLRWFSQLKGYLIINVWLEKSNRLLINSVVWNETCVSRETLEPPAERLSDKVFPFKTSFESRYANAEKFVGLSDTIWKI